MVGLYDRNGLAIGGVRLVGVGVASSSVPFCLLTFGKQFLMKERRKRKKKENLGQVKLL